MTDTIINLTPSVAGAQGPQTVTASSPLFTPGDVGRLLSIRGNAPERVANAIYGAGAIFCSNYNAVYRVYRVTSGGTTKSAALAGTTPNYDQNAPRESGLDIIDGTCRLKYLGAGKQAWGWGRIQTVIDSTHVTVVVDPRAPFAEAALSLRWRMGEWCDGRGYPRCVTFHQQRTVWAGSIAKPQTMWISQSGDFENLGPCEPDGTVLDTNAITVTLDDDQLNTVKWMTGLSRGLAVGVESGEFLLGPASTVNAALSPTNIRANREGDRGSADVAGLRISGVALFVEQGGRKIRQLEYDFGSDSFTTADLTQLSDQILGPGIVQIAHQKRPEGTIWLVRADGVLASLTFDREQKVRAWATHTIGGSGGNLGGFVESVCVIPSPDGKTDDVYIAVVRVISGVVTRSIEYIRAPYRADVDGPNAGFFVDGGLSYTGPPVSAVTGLDHLEGTFVAICADGTMRASQLVVGGRVAITGGAASVIHAGQPMQATLLTLPPETPGGQGGSIQGRQKRIGDVYLRFLDTAGGRFGAPATEQGIGADAERTEPLAFPESENPLFTGDHRLPFPGGVDREGQMLLVADQALPMTLLAITYDLVTNA